ncbi:uncharacterized conserved membrane protein [Lachnospiraceae bacterium KM106-2]|nr:uncharacterized conserved membrane protein [Lachnospiraceae bacterium KM106-2]
MNGLAIILFILWIYMLSVLKRGKLHFWFFFLGSVGMFLFLLIWVKPLVTDTLTHFMAYVTGLIGSLSHMFDGYYEYSILFIDRGKEAISLYIDYECSGIIEMMAFTALIWFFPLYQLYEKIVINIFGIFFIIASNVIRITIIVTLVYYKGDSIYYLAHTIVGRLVFYALSIGLYYYVFTKAHIVRQKVGSFSYETH